MTAPSAPNPELVQSIAALLIAAEGWCLPHNDPKLCAEVIAKRIVTDCAHPTVRTTAELAALPVGTVVRTNWASEPLQYVCQRFSDGWYTMLHTSPVYPLGSQKSGDTASVIYRPSGVTT